MSIDFAMAEDNTQLIVIARHGVKYMGPTVYRIGDETVGA